ncbi:related to wd-repeat protein 8 [Sporisorium reilianum f. sp. reilianum]|uniref:Related to wd-repeat protein 8 n=1 Tax=Sporisorium reilianum f. sp. reilianum TaxID=72559 RepID=A0A2N8U5A6_9BASI|nr:related to wd-repeat protein 8 [Sporisorium reilianum f. sp. reilianum]
MDFTAAYRHAAWRCIAFSPGSTFLASVTGDDACSVVVRASSTLQVIRTWTLESSISILEWSPDGAFLLAAHPGQKEDGVVFVVSLDPAKEANDGSDAGSGWVARISSGSDGLAHATWAPPYGPKTLILFSQNHLRASLYNLVDQHISAIEGPKHDKIAWTPKQPNLFASILKGAERDSLYVLSCQKLSHKDLQQFTNKPKSDEMWKVEQAFHLGMNDAHDVLWAPDGGCLAVWEGPLEYKLQIYTPLGALRATFLIEPDSDTNTPVTRAGAGAVTESRQPSKRRQESTDLASVVAGGGSGIRQLDWHPSSLFLAVGGGDEKVRILESMEWEEIALLDLSSPSIRASKDAPSLPIYGPLIAWREPLSWLEETRGRGIVALEQASLPVSLSSSKSDSSKSGAKQGIAWMAWSPEGNLLAALNERLPHVVWIFAFAEPGEGRVTATSPRLLAVLQLNGHARKVCWRPGHVGKLGVVCDNRAVYSWELIATSASQYRQRAEAIPIPNDDLKASQLQWSPDGQKILLASDSLFCCAFEAGEG